MDRSSLSLEQVYANLPIRFRRQLVQAYRLARVSYRERPLELIRFAARMARHIERSDRTHAERCTDPNCPAFDIEDQLQDLRRLLAIRDEPDLSAAIWGVLAIYDDRRTIYSHLGGQDTVAVVKTPAGRFRWCLTQKDRTGWSQHRFLTFRAAETSLAAYLRR